MKPLAALAVVSLACAALQASAASLVDPAFRGGAVEVASMPLLSPHRALPAEPSAELVREELKTTAKNIDALLDFLQAPRESLSKEYLAQFKEAMRLLRSESALSLPLVNKARGLKGSFFKTGVPFFPGGSALRQAPAGEPSDETAAELALAVAGRNLLVVQYDLLRYKAIGESSDKIAKAEDLFGETLAERNKAAAALDKARLRAASEKMKGVQQP